MDTYKANMQTYTTPKFNYLIKTIWSIPRVVLNPTGKTFEQEGGGPCLKNEVIHSIRIGTPNGKVNKIELEFGASTVTKFDPYVLAINGEFGTNLLEEMQISELPTGLLTHTIPTLSFYFDGVSVNDVVELPEVLVQYVQRESLLDDHKMGLEIPFTQSHTFKNKEEWERYAHDGVTKHVVRENEDKSVNCRLENQIRFIGRDEEYLCTGIALSKRCFDYPHHI